MQTNLSLLQRWSRKTETNVQTVNPHIKIEGLLIEAAEDQLKKLGPASLWIGAFVLLIVNTRRFMHGDYAGIAFSIIALAIGWFVIKAKRISVHTRLGLFVTICLIVGYANLYSHGLIENGRIVLFYACIAAVSLNRWKISMGVLALSALGIFLTGLSLVNGTLELLPAVNHPPVEMADVYSYTLYFAIFVGTSQLSSHMIYKRLIIGWQDQMRIEAELREQNRLVQLLVSQREQELEELKQSRNELAIYKNQLEEMVHQRTLELHVERDRANEANEAKSLFVARMSHELRTPLNAILGYSELMMEECEEDEITSQDLVPDLGKIEKSGRHLLELINNVLDLSKIESDNVEIKKKKYHLKELVDEVEINTLPLAANNGNMFKIQNDIPAEIIETDRQRFKQILINLLGNAFKFTQNGEVLLHISKISRAGEKAVQIQVIDNGRGMEESFMDRLFEPFAQEYDTLSRREDGTGLGLSITKSLANLIGGEIEVSSELGVGTTFSLFLPAQEAVVVD